MQPKTQTNGHRLGLLRMLRTQRGHSRLRSCLLLLSVYINSHGYTCSAVVVFFVCLFLRENSVLWLFFPPIALTGVHAHGQILRTMKTIGVTERTQHRQQRLPQAQSEHPASP